MLIPESCHLPDLFKILINPIKLFHSLRGCSYACVFLVIVAVDRFRWCQYWVWRREWYHWVSYLN